MRSIGPRLTVCFALIVFGRMALDAQTTVRFSAVPGEYAENVELTITSPEVVEYRFEGSDRFVEYTRPLELTALAGESRLYTIFVRTAGHESSVSYRISRIPPSTPIFEPPPGRYRDPVEVRFIVPEQQSVFYSLEETTARFLEWDGTPITIGEFDQQRPPTTGAASREHTIRAYSRDPAGRVTSTTNATYVIEPDLQSPSEPAADTGPPRKTDRPVFDSDLPAPRVSLDLRTPAGPAYFSVDPPNGSTAVFVVLNNETEVEPDAGSPEIRGEHAVRVPWGMRRDFMLVFRTRTDDGVLSSDTERISFSLDRVPPARPEFAVGEPDFSVSIEEVTGTVFFRVEADYPDVPGTTAGFVRYEQPFHLAPFIDEVPIRYAVAAYSRGKNGLIGPIAKTEFSATLPISYRVADDSRDDLSPPIPIGIDNGATYPGAVTVRVASTADTVVRYAISDNDHPDPFGPDGALYRTPVTLAGKNDAITEYKLRFAAVNTAGEIALSEIYTIAIDRRVPGPVAVLAFDTKTEKPVVATANPVRLEMIADLGEIFYEIEHDRVAPPPDRNSPRYDGPFKLDVTAGATATTFSIRAVAITPSGTWGRITDPVRVVIDRRVPPDPPAPVVEHDSTGARGLISWPTHPDFGLDYRFLGPESPSDTFSAYEAPVSWEIPPGRDEVTVEYALSSPLGAIGRPVQTTIRKLSTAPAPVLSGVEPGAVSNTRVTVVAESDTGVVRFELARDGRPNRVTEYSRQLPDQLELDVEPGERAKFTLAARTFVEGRRPSETTTLEFAINKAPPPPPEILGVVHGGHYQEARDVSLAPSDEDAFFSVITHTGTPTDDDFAPYEGPITLHPVDGDIVRYRVDAFARDAAGNTSRRATTTVQFDANVVYVAPDGRDTAEGTSDSPFQTIAAGIAAAETYGQRTVYLASGTYRVSSPIEIAGRISIIGSRARNNWDRNGTQSLIVADHDSSAFKILTDGVELTDLSISSTNSPALEIVNDAGVAVTRGRFTAHSTVVANDGGVLRVDGARIESSGIDHGAALTVSNGTVSFTGGEILARGQNARALLATNSESLFWSSSIVVSGSDEYVTAISVFGGHFEAGGVLILASAQLGSTAIRSDGATVFLEASRVHASATGDFAYGVSQNGGTTRLDNSILTATGGTDCVGVLVRGGGTFEATNVVLGTTGDETLSYGVWLRSGGAVRVRNSILLGDGTAIAHEGATREIAVVGTYFGGWDSVYAVESGSFGRVDSVRGTEALDARDDIDAFLNLDGPRDVLDAAFNPLVEFLSTSGVPAEARSFAEISGPRPPAGARVDEIPSLPNPRN